MKYPKFAFKGLAEMFPYLSNVGLSFPPQMILDCDRKKS